MNKYLITVAILCFYTKTVVTDANLQQQSTNQDQLDPVNDFENIDNSVKDQDKRTIFNPNEDNYGWAKHIGYHPSGFKYVLGYSPVDLKFSPVIRPLSVKHHGYAYGRPRLHLHIKKPAIHIKSPRPIYHHGWKPTRPIARPLLRPPHFVNKPAVSKPVHIDHIHTHVDHVHAKPVHHVDHVHQFPVPHVDHIHESPVHSVALQHADHVHNIVQPVPVQHIHVQPVHQVPVQPVAPLPFVPSPLFEVTKPDLGVLPLGAVFPSSVLRHIPSPSAVLPLSPRPALIPQPVAPAAIPLPQPVPLPVPRPAVISQPVYPAGTFVEYHGNTNFINLLKGQEPAVPHLPVNAPHPELPHHFHLQYPQILQNSPPQQQAHLFPNEQHDVQTPFVPINHPHFFQQPRDQPQFQQQLPADTPTHFSNDQVNTHHIYQQQLPVNSQPQFQTEQDNQNVYHQQLPQDQTTHFQPADQVSNQHFYHQSTDSQQDQFQPIDQTNNGNNGYVYQQPDISNLRQSIQPGQTDLQLPVHLPQHPGFVQSSRQFQSDNFQEPQYSESVFRPSIQLEPPYKK